MNRKRVRTIINQKLKEGYFKKINSIIVLTDCLVSSPNPKYMKKILNQSREQYDKMRNYVDGYNI